MAEIGWYENLGTSDAEAAATAAAASAAEAAAEAAAAAASAAEAAAKTQFGDVTGGDYAEFAADGTLRMYGAATSYDDLLRDAVSTRVGTVSPTTGTGWRGDANFIHTTFVHTQADEVQFSVQLPHRGKADSILYPHVHFSPTTTGTGTVQFIMEYYPANVNGQFPATPETVTMTKTWAVNQQWYHLIAPTASGMDIGSWSLSNVWMCRLYRDNTVTGNYAAAVTFLYFDVHVEIDAFGSAAEYSK